MPPPSSAFPVRDIETPDAQDAVPATHIEARSSDDLRRRYFWLIAVGIMSTALTNPGSTGVGGQPLKYLLKTNLHLQPQAMAAFFALGSIAFYFKPAVGILTDAIPLFGTRRRWYLILAASLAGAFWLLLGVVPRTYHSLLYTTIVINTLLMAISTVVGGLVVEAGQHYHATGRFASLRSLSGSVSSFLAGPIAGFLATRSLVLTAGVGAALPFGLAVLAFFLLRERPVAALNRDVGHNLSAQYRSLFRSRTLWAAAGAYFLFYFAPGFHTPLYYYQTNTLHLEQQFIGNLGSVGSGMGLLGAVGYGLLCRRVTLRTLMTLCVALSAASTLCYHFYDSRPHIIMVEGVVGLCFTLAELSLLDLAARATPRGSESVGYALMLSIRNGALSLSDVIGARLFEHYHLTFRDLIWLNAGSTALVLLIIPFLPRLMMRSRDGEGAAVLEEASAKEFEQAYAAAQASSKTRPQK